MKFSALAIALSAAGAAAAVDLDQSPATILTRNSIWRRDTFNFQPCETNTCPSDQLCYARKINPDETYCVLSQPTPIKGQCSSDYSCIKKKKGLVCDKGKCYAVPPSKQINQKCDALNPCASGLVCHDPVCKKPKNAECSSSDECVPGEPCVNGKCSLLEEGQACDAQTADHCRGILLYCSKTMGVCRKKAPRGGACLDGEGNGCASGTKCYAATGTCELNAYKQPCGTPGDSCHDGLICSAESICEYRLQAGAACQASGDCEFGLCYQGKCQELSAGAGFTCTNDIDCAEGKLCTDRGYCCPRGNPDCA